MEETLTIPFSSALSVAVGLIAFGLLVPFPFLWPFRIAKSRKRFPRSGAFCLVVGFSSYLLIGCISVVLLAIAAAMHDAGVLGNAAAFSPLRMFIQSGSYVLAVVIVLVTVWVADNYVHRWRGLVTRYLS